MTLPGLGKNKVTPSIKSSGFNGLKIEGDLTVKTLLFDLLMRWNGYDNRDVVEEDIIAINAILNKYNDVSLEPISHETGQSVFWEAIRLGMPCVQTSGKPTALFLYLKDKFVSICECSHTNRAHNSRGCQHEAINWGSKIEKSLCECPKFKKKEIEE